MSKFLNMKTVIGVRKHRVDINHHKSTSNVYCLYVQNATIESN